MSTPAVTGRAWLPASTGLPTDRPPTREEAREAWMRQARGVFEMTRRSRVGDAAAARANVIVAVFLVLAGGAFFTGLVMLPAAAQGPLAISLHVVVGVLLLLAQIAGPSTMAGDAVAEVTAKSAQAWASSPLSTSAWVAGKSAFYVLTQAMVTLRVLPFAAASAMLGGIRLREVIIVGVVGLAWTFIAGVGVASASLEPRRQLTARLANRPGVVRPALGGNPAFRGSTPPAAAFAVVQIALGIAGIFMALPFALGGLQLSTVPAPVALILAALCVLSPIGAGASAFFPGLGITVAGLTMPMWVVSLIVAVAVAPGAVAMSRLRWRPPDGSLGLGVRPSVWFAWTIIAALAMATLSSSAASAAVFACALPLITAAIPALTAGSTRLPDLAAEASPRWRRVAGLDRSTAATHALLLLALATLAAALFAPRGLFASLPSVVGMLALAVACVPAAFVCAAAGREGRKAIVRVEAGVKDKVLRLAQAVFGIMVFASFAPAVAAMLTALGLPWMRPVVDVFALVSPLHALLAVAGVLELQLPGGAPAAEMGRAALGVTLQVALALLAVRLEKRSDAKDDFTYATPPPPE